MKELSPEKLASIKKATLKIGEALYDLVMDGINSKPEYSKSENTDSLKDTVFVVQHSDIEVKIGDSFKLSCEATYKFINAEWRNNKLWIETRLEGLDHSSITELKIAKGHFMHPGKKVGMILG